MKRALLLGGGGMFGAYQAGVYQALYGRVEIHCVVGASAGSLNAWAIAGGATPEELIGLWMQAGELAKLKFQIPTGALGSFLDANPLHQNVNRMVEHWRPKMEIGVVISQGRDFHQVLIRDADITADVLLASCAVPFLLPAKRIGGRISVDGGLRDACPEWAARDMGATEIIAVNVWTHLPWWWVRGGKGPRRDSPDVLRLDPPSPLGPLRTSMVWNEKRVKSWIEFGRQTAESRLARK